VHDIAISLAAYIAAAAVLTITPGLDTALVVRTATAEGAGRALRAGLGVAFGCLIWTAIVAAGLGALLVASRLAYTVLRWAGAVYLLYVGCRLLRHPRARLLDEPGPGRPGGSAFARGALTNLLNPKVGVFYVSFLPQFIPNDVPVAAYTLLLGAIHALLGVLWFVCLIAATRPLLGLLRRPAVVKTLDRITGGIFVAFGARLAVSR
jgi:threonine/homoserine/homoserine lactone efflux protein